MAPGPTERIDAFPYRHRLAEVMGSPVVTAAADLTLAAAAARMLQAKVSSLVLLDDGGRPVAIFTEHDLLTAIATKGDAALGAMLGDHASRPVETLPADAFVYRALGRMDRRGVRHLVVVDPGDGRALGVVSARGLLKQRAGRALALGDAIGSAADAAGLAAVHAELPALAAALISEGLDARSIAALISTVVREISARAAELAARDLAAEGRAAPARWCFLVLGSGGRGESQLIPDQDNAIVHYGSAADDPWFAELGRRAADVLNEAGVPYCKGKVMASNPNWRGNLDQWRRRIDHWVGSPSPEDLLSVDIFYDFQPVFGDRALAEALRAYAGKAATSRPFLVVLSRELADVSSAIGFFGGLRTAAGRIDLKLHGLLPVVAGARVLALSLGVSATSTVERLRAARDAGIVTAADEAALESAQALFLHHILAQQTLDIAAGIAPSVTVEIARLTPGERRRLKTALRDVGLMSRLVENALSAGH